MHSHNIFITGKPRSGKSTLVRELIAESDKKVVGLSTPEIRKEGERVGFALKDLVTGEEGVLAHVDISEGPLVGKYRVNLEDLERFTKACLKDLPHDTDLMVIDEIGKMEMFSEEFKKAVDYLLQANIPVLAVLHRDLTDEYGSMGTLYTLDDNFEEVKAEILTDIR